MLAQQRRPDLSESSSHQTDSLDLLQAEPQAPLSADEELQKKLTELAESHASQMAKNKLYALATQQQAVLLKEGRFFSTESDHGGDVDKDKTVQLDPSILEHQQKIEKMKSDLLTEKQMELQHQLRINRTGKPNIIHDRSR